MAEKWRSAPLVEEQPQPAERWRSAPLAQDGALSADNAVRAVARGVPGGSFLDEIDAATNATLAPLVDPLLPDSWGFQELPGETWQERYDQALAIQRGKDTAFDAENPKTSIGLQIAGGVGGAGAALKAAPALASKALGLGGKTLGGKIVAGMGSGGAIGLVQGFGAGEGGGADRAREAMLQGGTGAVIGGVIPVAGHVVGKTVGAIRNRGGVTQSAERNALRRIADAMDADAVTDDAVRELGDEAMIADLGPNLRQQAEAVAATPGQGQKTVRSALGARRAGAGARVESAANETLGAAMDVSDIVETGKRAAKPFYDEFRASTVNLTDDIRQVLGSPAGKLALNKATRLAANEGVTIDPANPGAIGLDYVKRSIDDMIGAAQRAGKAQEARALVGLKNKLVGAVDEQVPIYRAARETFAGAASVQDAFEEGQRVFSRSMSPVELRKAMSAMSDAERDAFRQGARAWVEELMGTARNDAGAAYRELAEKGWNRDKLTAVIGAGPAKRLLLALNREKTFSNTADAVLGNSATTRRMAGLGDLRPKNAGSIRTAFENGGPMGAVRAAGLRGLDFILGDISDVRFQELLEKMGQGLVAQGVERDRLLQMLAKVRQDTATNALVARRAELLTDAALRGAGGAAAPEVAEGLGLRRLVSP